MQAAQTKHIARPLIILKTDGKANHDPVDWAKAVASGMVWLDPDMPSERTQMAIRVRLQLVTMLREAFEEVRAYSSLADIRSLARTCMKRVEEIFAPSPWALSASHPEIRAEFERYITMNLASSVHVAVTTE